MAIDPALSAAQSSSHDIWCRQAQVEQLTALLAPQHANPKTLVVHGTRAVGKTLTVCHVLKTLNVPHGIVQSRECITGRHLLERAVLACKSQVEALGYGPFRSIDGRCENLTVLSELLQRLLAKLEHFVLVFDAVDHQRDAPPTLLPALARLGETCPNLTVLLIVTAPRLMFLATPGVPYVHFPPYTRDEILRLVSVRPLNIDMEGIGNSGGDTDIDPSLRDDDGPWLWPRYCAAVWEAVGHAAARDVLSFRAVCEKLWPVFTAPIRSNLLHSRNIAGLINHARPHFLDESFLLPSIGHQSSNGSKKKASNTAHNLSYYTKLLLIAAYLASHNPTRVDLLYFSHLHEHKKKKKRRTIPGMESVAGGGPTGNGAVAGSVGANSGNGGGGGGTTSVTAPSTPRTPRAIQRRLLGAQPFTLDRLLAILHAIAPHGPIPAGSADLLIQVATLGALRMLLRVPASGDPLDAATKWKVNVGWEVVQTVARSIRFDIEDFLAV